MELRTQSWARTGRAIRYAYVIEGPGPGDLFVSHYRYASEASAMKAGQADIDTMLALDALAIEHVPDDDGNCPVVGFDADMCDLCYRTGWQVVDLMTRAAR